MDLPEIYKEHYFFELNRSNELTGQLSIPVGVVTLLIGLIAFFLDGVELVIDSIHIIFGLLVIISIVLLTVTIYYLIRCYHGSTYKYKIVPTPQEIEDYRTELDKYYDSFEPILRGDVDQELKDILLAKYAEYTHNNLFLNIARSNYLFKAKRSMVLSLIFVILCGAPYFGIKFTQPESVEKFELVNFPIDKLQPTQPKDVQKVELVNLPVDKLEKEKVMAEENHDTSSEQKPPQVKPEKPEPPKGHIIREGVEPEKIEKK